MKLRVPNTRKAPLGGVFFIAYEPRMQQTVLPILGERAETNRSDDKTLQSRHLTKHRQCNEILRPYAHNPQLASFSIFLLCPAVLYLNKRKTSAVSSPFFCSRNNYPVLQESKVVPNKISMVLASLAVSIPFETTVLSKRP